MWTCTTTKIFRKEVSYRFKNSETFEEEKIILYNKYLYFGTKINNYIDKINFKFNLKSIGIYYNKKEEGYIINLLIQSSEQENEEENSLNKNEDNGNINENHIIVKLNDEKTKEEISGNINQKILSNNNEERLAFEGYFNEINNNIKETEEDF